MNPSDLVQLSPTFPAALVMGIVVLGVALVIGAAKGRVSSGLFEPSFRPQILLNKSEQRLYGALIKAVPPEARLLCQVSYGEILSCRSRKKYRRVNSKRADFVVCDRSWLPLAVIEYQGAGHSGSTRASAKSAVQRDRTKRHAVREAGLAFIEVPARYNSDTLAELLSPLRSDHHEEKQEAEC